MGLDCWASIVIGVHLEPHEQLTEVVKYDENTGKPYKKEVIQKYFTAGNMGAVDLNRVGEDHLIYADYADRNSFFIGVEVAKTYSHRLNQGLWETVPDLKSYWGDAERTLKEYGYNGPLKMYVLERVSY